MSYETIGKSKVRWDAVAKAKGEADYTDDIPLKNCLHAKIIRATITHGYVKEIDFSKALEVEGVVKILTYKDVPKRKFPTAGHPYSLDPNHKDKEDRNIFTDRVRLYGDEIGAVIGETVLACEQALDLIKVTYEELPFYLEAEEALAEDAVEIHEGSKNLIASSVLNIGDVEKGFEESEYILENIYETKPVHHCHMENQIAYAYKDSDGRWVCVSSTQIPHICRRILGEALDMPLGNFRVIKPFIGGGFGNKQDVVVEPIVVFLSMCVGGKTVKIDLPREEVFSYTRSRHGIKYKLKAGFTKDGKFKALKAIVYSNNGAYASHGHSIAAKGGGIIATLYNIENFNYDAKTVYTNIASAGAMRGYGVPQVIFAVESLVDDACKKYGFDPIDFRKENIIEEGILHPLSRLNMFTNGLKECIEKGVELFDYNAKVKAAKAFIDDDKARGVGMAAFSYATGVYPISLETAGCRISLNQDGTVKFLVGATEIGQGSDTVFSQMIAETVGIDYENVYADSKTDTDISPFDTGAYASRQTYVTGMAVRKCAEELKSKILNRASAFYDVESSLLDIKNGVIIYNLSGDKLCDLSELALKTYYDKELGSCITAEVSNNFHNNNFPMGVTFAEVEVDKKTGKITILSILNVHDSGVIMNPILATGQVEGGMGMGVGYAIGEVLRYDEKTGKPLNNNLLDYKMPTIMDMPNFDCEFVEKVDPTGPYGNKGLGEPPLCSPGGAIRNAVLDAINVGINELPLAPQTVFEAINRE